MTGDEWVVVCAWCPEDQQIKGENVSHGICAPCSEIFLAPARARQKAEREAVEKAITRAIQRLR